MIVWIHGGALIMGSRSRINPDHLDRYIDAGFAVVAIDYRLAPETLLPVIAEDLQDAFAWVRNKLAKSACLDPERVAVVGHSAGGYLTLLSGCLIEPRPQALVAFYGYGDIAGDWYSHPDEFYRQQPLVAEADARAAVGGQVLADADDRTSQARRSFYLWCRQQGRWPNEVVGADPHAEPGAFEPWCPVRHVTAEYPPTLLLHGDEDTDVPYAQSVQMAGALARAEVEHEFITIAGGGHGFERDMADQPVVQDAVARVVAFLSRQLASN
ncbi:MAG: alpha/beta hydrolase [Thermomicrobiales bacterium]